MFCLALCYFVLVFFSPFSIAITSLGEERANLSAFHTFVRFALVCFCLFPLPLCVWDGLRLVIVALPGLFSYLFCTVRHSVCEFISTIWMAENLKRVWHFNLFSRPRVKKPHCYSILLPLFPNLTNDTKKRTKQTMRDSAYVTLVMLNKLRCRAHF